MTDYMTDYVTDYMADCIATPDQFKLAGMSSPIIESKARGRSVEAVT